MATLQIDIGERFGKLIVIAPTEKTKAGHRFICLCDCGGEKVCFASRLRAGMTKSCGCLARGINSRGNPNLTRKTHGERRGPNGKPTPEYVAWMHLIDRCNNPRNRAYANYGGRGIRVWPAWVESYEAFLADMGRKPTSAHSLDRIDVNGGYEPTNCHWATRTQQSQNARSNRVVSLRGRTICLSEACRQVGLPYDTVRARLERGWSDARALGV